MECLGRRHDGFWEYRHLPERESSELWLELSGRYGGPGTCAHVPTATRGRLDPGFCLCCRIKQAFYSRYFAARETPGATGEEGCACTPGPGYLIYCSTQRSGAGERSSVGATVGH